MVLFYIVYGWFNTWHTLNKIYYTKRMARNAAVVEELHSYQWLTIFSIYQQIIMVLFEGFILYMVYLIHDIH